MFYNQKLTTNISVIIPTWNSNDYLPICMAHLSKQTVKPFEIIIVDNGSKNYRHGQISSEWPSLKITEMHLNENKGFAAAGNLGANVAKSEWIAFLNADAYVDSDWIEILLSSINEFPQAKAFGSLILQDANPDIIDSAGDIYNISGIAWKGYSGYPKVIVPENPRYIFSPCAAAALYNKEVFLKIGGFDEDFFSYFEDVDLGFRINLFGYHCISIPKACARHVGSSSTSKESDFSLYHFHRNVIWSYLKNMPGLLFWLYLPFHILSNLFFLLQYAKNKRGKIVFKAKKDALKDLKIVLEKRKKIQKERQINIYKLNKIINRNLFAPYQIGRKLKKYNREHQTEST